MTGSQKERNTHEHEEQQHQKTGSFYGTFRYQSINNCSPISINHFRLNMKCVITAEVYKDVWVLKKKHKMEI